MKKVWQSATLQPLEAYGQVVPFWKPPILKVGPLKVLKRLLLKYFTVKFLKNGLLRFFLKLSYENSATYEHFWVFSHFSVHRWRYFHMTIDEKILKVHFLKNSTVKYFNRNFFRTFKVPTLRFGEWFFQLITFYSNPFGRGVQSNSIDISLKLIKCWFDIHSIPVYKKQLIRNN